MTDAATDEPLITVEIRQLPIELQVAAQQHADELTRELVLVAEQLHQQGNPGDLPQRFVELVSTLSGTYSVFTVEQEKQLAEAIAARQPSLDMVYTVPRSAASAAASLGQVFDEADGYCRAGRLLLTLETPPELVTYRRWFLDQFVDQAEGKPPVSWPDYAAAAAPTG